MLAVRTSLIFPRILFLAISTLIISCGTIPVPERQSARKTLPVETLSAKTSQVDTGNIEKIELNKDSIIKAEVMNETSTSAINPKTIVSANDVEPVVKQSANAKNIKQEVVRHQSKNTAQDVNNKPVTSEKMNQKTIRKRMGKKRFAQAEIKYQAEQYADATAILEELTRLFTENFKYRDLLVLTYTKYAEYLEDKADLLEAQTILEKALGIQPYNRDLQKQLKELENRRQADLHYATGLQAVKASQQDKAIDAFNRALNLKPDHELVKKQIVLLKIKFADSYHKKAMILYRKQKLDEAIETWGRVLVLDPGHDMAKLYRARAVGLKEKLERL